MRVVLPCPSSCCLCTNLTCSGLTCHLQLQPHCSCAGDCMSVRTMLYKQQITVHQAIKRMCVKSMLHTFAVYSHCGSSCSAEVARRWTSPLKQRSIEQLMSSCQDVAYLFTRYCCCRVSTSVSAICLRLHIGGTCCRVCSTCQHHLNGNGKLLTAVSDCVMISALHLQHVWSNNYVAALIIGLAAA